jgi:hypothetical protein
MRHSERRCEGLVQLRPSIIVVAGLEPGDFNLGGVMLQKARWRGKARRRQWARCAGLSLA